MADRIPDPAEARRYLSRKAVVETEDWDDLKWGEHAHAFTVAHSRNAAVLDDIFGLMNKAMDGGESYETFRQGLRSLMEKKGWYGRGDKGPDDEGYINWRTKLIYHVNMRTAYEAGRYRQQLRGAELRPIWVYKSKLVGKNRRQDHVAMHDKALRYDDPFWNTHRPPNGWGCECSVVTLSEAGAEREGIEVISSGPSGNPPAMVEPNGSPVNWDRFTPEEWRYNPGREALAPNFSRYKALHNMRTTSGERASDVVRRAYRNDMDQTRLTEGEFNTLANRFLEGDYQASGIMYQVGNLEEERYKAMVSAGIEDSKVMSSDKELYHGIGDKNEGQKIPKEKLALLYKTLQTPERIHENVEPENQLHGREFHFSCDSGDGKIVNVVVRQKTKTSALKVVTMGWIGDDHGAQRYKRLW